MKFSLLYPRIFLSMSIPIGLNPDMTILYPFLPPQEQYIYLYKCLVEVFLCETCATPEQGKLKKNMKNELIGQGDQRDNNENINLDWQSIHQEYQVQWKLRLLEKFSASVCVWGGGRAYVCLRYSRMSLTIYERFSSCVHTCLPI